MLTLLEAALWTEKYRPKTLDEIVNQEEIVSRLKEFVKRGTMPHCLFAGPPGTGHTIHHNLFQYDYYYAGGWTHSLCVDVLRVQEK